MRRGVVCGLLAAVVAAGVGHANPYDGRLLSLKDLKKEARQNEALDDYMTRNGLPDVAESRVLSDRPPWDGHQVTLYYLGTRKEISFARAMVLGKADISITRYERDLTDADVAALVGILDTAAIEADVAPAVETVAFVDGTEVPALAEPVDTATVAPETAAEDEVFELAAVDEDVAIGDVLEFDMTNPADRAEAAALRAEQAADRVEDAADKTEAAALRAEKAFDRLAAAVEAKRAKRKR